MDKHFLPTVLNRPLQSVLKSVLLGISATMLLLGTSGAVHAQQQGWILADIARDSDNPFVQGTGAYTVSQTRPDVSAHVDWSATTNNIARVIAHYTLHFQETNGVTTHLLRIGETEDADGSIVLGQNSQGDPVPLQEGVSPSAQATYAASDAQFSDYRTIDNQGTLGDSHSGRVFGNTDVGRLSYPVSGDPNPISVDPAFPTDDQSGGAERFLPCIVNVYTEDNSTAGQNSSATAKAYLSVSDVQ